MIENKDDLPNAIALNSFIFNGALLIGPAVAGILIAAVGEGLCFAINSLSYLSVVGALMMMKIPKRKFSSSALGFKASIIEGATYTFASVPIRSILIFVAVVSFVAASYPLLMPVYAERTLQGGPRVFGYLMSATGVGALAGAIFLASRNNLKGLGEMIVIAAILFVYRARARLLVNDADGIKQHYRADYRRGSETWPGVESVRHGAPRHRIIRQPPVRRDRCMDRNARHNDDRRHGLSSCSSGFCHSASIHSASGQFLW
jgi:hypothetical protein